MLVPALTMVCWGWCGTKDDTEHIDAPLLTSEPQHRNDAPVTQAPPARPTQPTQPLARESSKSSNVGTPRETNRSENPFPSLVPPGSSPSTPKNDPYQENSSGTETDDEEVEIRSYEPDRAHRVKEIDYRHVQAVVKRGHKIAQGSYGAVYRCQYQGRVVAIKKILLRSENDEKAALDFCREVSLLSQLDHPNILTIEAACTKFPNLCFLAEYIPRGSLFDVLHKQHYTQETFPWERRISLALHAARGMQYLHAQNPVIVHRDLKSMNLLVTHDWRIKIADFGISRPQHGTYLSTCHVGGSPAWMAPETLRSERTNKKVDSYAFGVILWELMTLKRPWRGKKYADIVRLCGLEGRRLPLPETPTNSIDMTRANAAEVNYPTNFVSLIELCFAEDPEMRPEFDKIVEVLEKCNEETNIIRDADALLTLYSNTDDSSSKA